MKVKDTTILMVPGYSGSGPEHWQTRWEQKLSTASRVQQRDWHAPDRTEWTGRVADAVNASGKPVMLVAHSLGVAAAVQAIPQFRTRVAGALLVAAPDLDADGDLMEERRQFGPWPRDPLPFPAMMIASRNDPWCDFAVAEEIASAWVALFLDAGEAGHINTEAGYGPWPEGSMAFAQFLSRLT